MKRLIPSLISLIILVISCKNNISKNIETSYNMRIKLPISNGDKFILNKIKKDLTFKTIDTLNVVDGELKYKFSKQNPDIVLLQSIYDDKKKIAFIMGDGDVIININKNYDFFADVSQSTSKLTKQFFDFEKNVMEDRQEGIMLMQSYKKADSQAKKDSIKEKYTVWRDNAKKSHYDFIKNNKNIIGLVVMQSLMMSPEADMEKIRKFFYEYPEETRQTGMGKYINTQILIKGATKLGGKAPVFIAPKPDGKKISLNQVMGKVTLIDFWASWCRPCRAENPYVVEIYKKYHDRGFNIIGVSLDKNKESWLKAIEDDKLTWQHVSNLKFWDEPIAKMYSVLSIPQTFLLDEKGIIRAKNLRREKLENKIVELLEK